MLFDLPNFERVLSALASDRYRSHLDFSSQFLPSVSIFILDLDVEIIRLLFTKFIYIFHR